MYKYLKSFTTLSITLLLVGIIGLIYFKDAYQVKSESVSKNLDSTRYINFTPIDLTSSELKGKSVLFFAATAWCQTCSALDHEIMTRNTEIPQNVTILKVDYDNDKAMKLKYRVTTQHTLIVLDTKGNEITRWVGGGFDTLLQNLRST